MKLNYRITWIPGTNRSEWASSWSDWTRKIRRKAARSVKIWYIFGSLQWSPPFNTRTQYDFNKLEFFSVSIGPPIVLYGERVHGQTAFDKETNAQHASRHQTTQGEYRRVSELVGHCRRRSAMSFDRFVWFVLSEHGRSDPIICWSFATKSWAFCGKSSSKRRIS